MSNHLKSLGHITLNAELSTYHDPDLLVSSRISAPGMRACHMLSLQIPPLRNQTIILKRKYKIPIFVRNFFCLLVFWLYLYLSFVCLSIYRSLSVYACNCLSVSLCLSLSLSVYICMYFCLPVYLSAYLISGMYRYRFMLDSEVCGGLCPSYLVLKLTRIVTLK